MSLVLCRVLVLTLEFYVEEDAISQNAICIADEKDVGGFVFMLSGWHGTRLPSPYLR